MAQLRVDTESIAELFGIGKRQYIVPEFQRPYVWEEDHCAALWDDITSCFEERGDNDEEYYLGSVVVYENKDQRTGKIVSYSVIDGQQRLTTILMLLRAIYAKIPEGNEHIPLLAQVAPCIWEVDDVNPSMVLNMKHIRVVSKVAFAEDNDIFHHIVQYGEVVNTSKRSMTNYEKNYTFFEEKLSAYPPLNWEKLCVFILKKCLLLPVKCENQKTALTIFATLNDRGEPLGDSDMFKAHIFKGADNPQEQESFVNDWNTLDVKARECGLSVDSVFRYYMHYLRGKGGVTEKVKKLRLFYDQEQLSAPGLLADILGLVRFWCEIFLTPDKETARVSIKARQLLDCLFQYPNEYWRYLLSVFFIVHQDREDGEFKQQLERLLERATAFFYLKFIFKPSVNDVKPDIYKACVALCAGKECSLEVEVPEQGALVAEMSRANIRSKLEKGIILLHAYLQEGQDAVIGNCEVEHIFPKQWQNTNYNGWKKRDADDLLENLGNKMPLEKKLNIQAGNGYFGRKREKYVKSAIAEAVAMGKYPKPDWVKDDIVSRKQKMMETLASFFMAQGVAKSK